MSTGRPKPDSESLGFPELTTLGKHIEVLRIGRGLSKQRLARFAGTSRQQLWRVMTGKSELTDALRSRLAVALQVDSAVLASGGLSGATATGVTPTSGTRNDAVATRGIGVSLDTYLATPQLAERTLRTLPNGDVGRELKRMILTALEDVALERRIALPAEFFELRRQVLSDEL